MSAHRQDTRRVRNMELVRGVVRRHIIGDKGGGRGNYSRQLLKIVAYVGDEDWAMAMVARARADEVAFREQLAELSPEPAPQSELVCDERPMLYASMGRGRRLKVVRA